MRLLILRSEGRAAGRRPEEPYAQQFSGSFAERVIANLIGEEGCCTACGPDCIACRKHYERKFGKHIVGVIALPGVLPYLLENPEAHLPRDVPAHDILLAINVHEQILLEFLKRCGRWGTRGVVAPVEAADWVSGSARAEARKICQAGGVEVAFPKPFCSFDPPAGSLLAEFRRGFHIGKPAVELKVRDARIAEAHVEVSAACGATYYVARWLAGRSLQDDLKYEVVAKRMHSYPCTASMAWDSEIGDTIMHVASQAHYEILASLTKEAAPEPEMVISPLGGPVLKPVPPRENIRNIERAKEAILEDLASGRRVSLRKLGRKRKIPPAAISSALLILKQEGKIRKEGGKIVRA